MEDSLAQASEMKGFIDLVWVPQSGKCAEAVQVMGYKPYYYFNHNPVSVQAELRLMIKTFKANGIGTIADVVVNHRNMRVGSTSSQAGTRLTRCYRHLQKR